MFASPDLARRVEAAEARLTLACGQALARRVPSAIVREMGAAAAVFSGVGSPMDKVLGLGFEPFGADAFARFEDEVLARGGSVRVEQSSLADPEVARALTARGYALIGYENVLGRAPVAGEAAGDTAVTRAEADELETWLGVVASAFLSPDANEGAPPPTESFDRAAIEEAGRDMAQVPGTIRYLAWRGGERAGGASMRVDGTIAQLTGAATCRARCSRRGSGMRPRWAAISRSSPPGPGRSRAKTRRATGSRCCTCARSSPSLDGLGASRSMSGHRAARRARACWATSASFSPRVSFFNWCSSRSAADQLGTRWNQASRTGRRLRVYFDAVPRRCCSSRRSTLRALPA
jgi:hypothetical protein